MDFPGFSYAGLGIFLPAGRDAWPKETLLQLGALLFVVDSAKTRALVKRFGRR
jgi:hypothetical protein